MSHGSLPPVRGWTRRTAPLLALLLLAGCEPQEPTAPADPQLPTPAEGQVVARLSFEVDPTSGSIAVRPAEARAPGQGPSLALAPVTGDHLRSRVYCAGCGDAVLDNQVITVRFTVGEVDLTGVDFRRTAGGEAIPAMTCANCRVREASLRGVATAPLPAELNPSDVFEAVLGVDALAPGPFTVGFDLVATEVRPRLSLFTGPITAGEDHSCALTREGRAYCWGANEHGQLGDGAARHHLVPTAVAGNHTFVAISAGTLHTIGLTSTGQALAWGANFSGQLGDGTTTSRRVPTPVAGNHTFVSLSAGSVHTVGLTARGEALAWGANYRGWLGDGTTTSRLVPTPVAGNHTFVSLDAGREHTVGLTASGQALAWGYNDTGRLGDGTTSGRLTPTPVAGSFPVR